MHTALITGLTGFVGTALARKMISDGWQVRGTFRSQKNMSSLPSRVEAVQMESIGPDIDWLTVLADIDIVVHLAARVHVMNDAADDPLAEFRHVNVAGTERLARMAAKAGVRRFVYLSSVKVNGEGGDDPYTEDDVAKPKDPYAVSKWEAEQVLNNIATETGLEVVVLRPPLVYGPHVKANFLKMLQLVDRGVPLPLMNIHNNRSLIYVNNLVDAISLCITHPKAAGETFLVSDGQDVSTPELIRMIASAMGKKPRLMPFPISLLRAFGKFLGKSQEIERLVGSLCVDSSKIRRTLGWKPPFTLEEGVGETVGWYNDKARSEVGGRRSEVRNQKSDI